MCFVLTIWSLPQFVRGMSQRDTEAFICPRCTDEAGLANAMYAKSVLPGQCVCNRWQRYLNRRHAQPEDRSFHVISGSLPAQVSSFYAREAY
jgi:hypothetical protein